jgi:hypothetical protein
MSQSELLARVVRVLDAAGIDYMVTGSTVSSIQGEPRSTHDIDVVIALTAASVDAKTRYGSSKFKERHSISRIWTIGRPNSV